MTILVGIDPGYKNLGLSIIHYDSDSGTPFYLYRSEVMDPSSFKSINKFVEGLDEIIDSTTRVVDFITIERFVAYGSTHTAESEDICMIIGGLRQYFHTKFQAEANLVRAIEWKTKLVKSLYKRYGFQNPSTSLDKKFSNAAANACLGTTENLPTDHESDAVCLACLPKLI